MHKIYFHLSERIFIYIEAADIFWLHKDANEL